MNGLGHKTKCQNYYKIVNKRNVFTLVVNHENTNNLFLQPMPFAIIKEEEIGAFEQGIMVSIMPIP